MKINYVYKKESDPGKFTAKDSTIELKEYESDLIFYSPLNSHRAEFAFNDKIGTFSEKPMLFTGGPFGSYVKLADSLTFGLENFSSLENNVRISFYASANTLTGTTIAKLRKKDNFPEEGLPKGTYSLTVAVDGYPTSALSFSLPSGASVSTIRNKLLFSLDPSIYPFELCGTSTETDTIALQNLNPGRSMNITDGLNGESLLKYFDVEVVDYGCAPIKNTKIFELFNLKIIHYRKLDNGIPLSYLRFTLGEQDIDVQWKNNAIDFDNIEVNIDDNLIMIFINGKMVKVELLKNKFENNGTTLSLFGTSEYNYSFDELIINKNTRHTKDFELAKTQLTKYSTEKPYIDFHFPGSNLRQGLELKTSFQSGIECCVCDNGSFYYYNAGAWRKASGEFNNANDWYTTSEKLKTFDFSGEDFFIRCFFLSDGTTLANLDVPYFEASEEDIQDQNGDVPAVLVGEKEWEDTEELNGLPLNITTNAGTSTIVFEKDTPFDIDEVVEIISDYYPDGIAKCYKDSKNRVCLISEDKGEAAYISVSGEAAPLIFGDANFSKGANSNNGAIDYSKFFETVRTYTDKKLILPSEVSDEQMLLFLKEALAYYKRFKGDEINQYTCILKGDWHNGYEIPSVIESQKDIVDILFKPIFPITFYAADFADGNNENIFALTLAQGLFSGRGGFGNSMDLTQNYYISLMGMQDFKQALGLNPSWEIINNRIYIYPSLVSRYTSVAIKYKAPLSEEECIRDPDIIKYVHGKCLMTIGSVRGQFGSVLSPGEASLTFNSAEMYSRGEAFIKEVIEYWKGCQPALGFFLG